MCTICNHANRTEIENAVLNISSAEGSLSIENIADHYRISIDDLKMHAMFHTPMVGADIFESKDEEKTSLTRKMKLREADMLSSLNAEYLVTLKSMGRRLNKLASPSQLDEEDEDKQFKFSKLLTKPMVELYLGLGGEIRQNIKAMADIERLLNGPEDSTSGGIAALAAAIAGSRNND